MNKKLEKKYIKLTYKLVDVARELGMPRKNLGEHVVLAYALRDIRDIFSDQAMIKI